MDNILVFVVTISYFRVPAAYQHRVLLWGVLGAIVMRGIMIGLGVALVRQFDWILYLFGAFLVFTGIKLLFRAEEEVQMERNLVLRLCRRFAPVTPDYVGQKFVVRQAGRLLLTPLAVVLLCIESTDLVFAVDSIPAIFVVTQDPFIIYTSNICAVLGLRSLYFLLANVVHRFVYLRAGLALVLALIGVKMLIADFWHMPTWMSLTAVLCILTVSVVASLFARPRTPPAAAQQGVDS
jgi:tellurite resistance protein TerC